MNNRNKLGYTLLIAALALAGCQKTDETATSAQPASGAGSGSASGSGAKAAGGSASRSAPAPAPAPAVLAAGTEFETRLVSSLSSKESTDGQTFEATLDKPIEVNGKTVIPKGADLTGRVTKAVPSGRLKERAELWVTLTSVKVGSKTYDITTSAAGQKEGSKATRDVVFIGGGAGGGAAIGGAVGGGKGAAIGAAIGAAAGTVGAAATGKRDISFPSESVLRFRLEQELRIP